ncbi:cupin domain-containing protein [Patescibacteria group bacterium]|nr:cupin domain-containing protein [Patescibacteria group bacterium]MCL5798413.1 cupin domain-containing protein [Patescibacteria group bacterium]
MTGYVGNIEEITEKNTDFRQVIYTAVHSQLVVMSIEPGGDIGMEVHPDVDQFLRIEEGRGKAILNGEEHDLSEGDAIVVPAGTNHNIINTSQTDALKLYTVYSPPNHPDGKVHKTKAQALADEEDHV